MILHKPDNKYQMESLNPYCDKKLSKLYYLNKNLNLIKMEFSALDLLWTKNVTREKGKAWAYDEYHIGDTFYLNFPLGNNRMGVTSAQKAKANELILLVQSIYNKTLGKPGTYLSHIVAPVDDEVEVDPVGSHPVKRLVTVVARDKVMIAKPTNLDFREPNRGWTCEIDLIKPKKDSGMIMTLDEKKILLWNLFRDKDLTIKTLINENQTSIIDPVVEAIEGEEKYRWIRHRYYERDPALIKAKKNEAKHHGPILCEACNFDFIKSYGIHGAEFMECHHRFPIAKHGKRTNTLEDLALVCSNCHRMLHRKNVHNDYYTVEQLKLLIHEISGITESQVIS